MTIIDSARSRSISSATNAGVAAAGRTTTNRSTFSGSEAGSATQRTPSIRSIPGFTTVMVSGSKPSCRMLRRITRPGLVPLETPTIPIDRGARRRATLCEGPGAPRRTRPVAQQDQDVQRDEAVGGDGGRVDLDLEHLVRDQRREAEHALDGLRTAGRARGAGAARAVTSWRGAWPSGGKGSPPGRRGEGAPGTRSRSRGPAGGPPRGPRWRSRPHRRSPPARSRPSTAARRGARRPGPASWFTNSATVKPSTASPRRSHIAPMAAATAATSLGTMATPPTSVLWRMPADTTFTTTRSPGSGREEVREPVRQDPVVARVAALDEAPARDRDPGLGEQREALRLQERRPAGGAGPREDGADRGWAAGREGGGVGGVPGRHRHRVRLTGERVHGARAVLPGRRVRG